MSRPVGLLERWSVARHNSGVYLNVSVVSRYEVPSSLISNDSKETLERIKSEVTNAIECVIKEHAALSVVLIDDDTNAPQFQNLDTFDLKRIIEWKREITIVEDEESEKKILEEVLQEQHSKRFQTEDKSIPLWRLLVIPLRINDGELKLWILFVFHHCISDGISALTFHSFLQNALRNPSKVSGTQRTFPSIELEECMEKRMEVKASWAQMTHAITTELLLPFWLSKYLGLITSYWKGQNPLKEQYGEKIDVKKGVKTRVSILKIQPENVLKLRDLCKEKKTTVNSVLCGLFSFSACATFNEGRSETMEFGIETPIETRKYFRRPVHRFSCMGVFMGGHTFSMKVGPSSMFWESCKAYGDSVNSKQGLDWSLGKIALLNYIPNTNPPLYSEHNVVYNTGWEKFIREKVNSSVEAGKSPRSESFGISNLGIWRNGVTNEGCNREDWKIDSSLFSQCNGPIASAMSFNVVTIEEEDGKMGSMNIVANWQKETFQESSVCEMMGLIELGITLLVSGEWKEETFKSFLEKTSP